MAKKDKQPDRAQASSAVPRRAEIIGVLLLVASLALCFALFSFDPDNRPHNLVGPAGGALAQGVFGAIGVVGYAASLVLVGAALAVILGRIRRPPLLGVLAFFGITLALAVMADMAFTGDRFAGAPPGGAVGGVLSELLRGAIGPAGASLLAAGVLMVSVLVISDLSLSGTLRDTIHLAKRTGLRLHAFFTTTKAARKAALEREQELVIAEVQRKLEARRSLEEKEKRLREELEEKQRLTIIKAQARAEERARARIAAMETKERVLREEREAREREAREAEERAAALAREAAEAPAEAAEEPLAADPGPVALEIPGPGAEPPIQIVPTENAADVLEEIAQLSERPSVAPEEPSGEAPVEEEQSAEGITIHERKQLDCALDDAGPVADAKKTVLRTFEMPPLNLLDYQGTPVEPVDGELLRAKATRLEEKLRTYGVEGRVSSIRPGPVVTTYEYQPAPGVKVAKIAALSDDIAMSMEAMRVRIVAPIPGRGVVGIELPNDRRESVYLKELIAHDSFKRSKSLLTLSLGKDAEGEPQVRDLRSMPHILIAGTTGSGKSVSVNAMILSILYKATPDQVKFIMVDPKMLELSLYNDIPHLLLPVVTDPRKASLALQWAVDEMERRYQLLSEAKVRDLDGFNKKLARLAEQRAADEATRALPPPAEDDPDLEASEEPAELALASEPPKEHEGRIRDPWPDKALPEPLPYIVVLIDEFADLMCVAPRDVEASVQRLAQKARAAGVHLMLATQRPSTDVITGVIKNNFPTRVSFRVASRHDSATILNAPGAENLLGMGDMLFLGGTAPSPTRIHGAFVSEDEVQRVVDFWKAQAKPTYDATILRKRDDEEGEGDEPIEHDEMYDKAVQIVTETRKASISAIQRRLRVGYNRAARMIEMMEAEGIVGPAMGPKGEREVLVRAMAADGPPKG